MQYCTNCSSFDNTSGKILFFPYHHPPPRDKQPVQKPFLSLVCPTRLDLCGRRRGDRKRKEGRKETPSPPPTFFHFLAHRGSVQACKGGGGGGGRECLFAKRRKEGGDLCWPPLPPLLAPRGEEDGKLVSSCPFLFQQLSFFSLPSLFPSLLCFSPAVVSSACAKLKGTGLTLAFSRFRGENVFVFRPPAPQADEEQAEAQQEPLLHHAHTGLAHMNYVNT